MSFLSYSNRLNEIEVLAGNVLTIFQTYQNESQDMDMQSCVGGQVS